MRLADSRVANRESILGERETFARTAVAASSTMGIGAPRNHANAMLTVIAADLRASRDALSSRSRRRGTHQQELPPS